MPRPLHTNVRGVQNGPWSQYKAISFFFQVAAISKRFEVEICDWAHSLRLFELFPIIIKSLVVGGRGGVGLSKSAPKFLKFLQGVLLMYWAYTPWVMAKKANLNPSYCALM
jgi:hypothetical protein